MSYALLAEFHKKLISLVSDYNSRLGIGELISSLEIMKLEIFVVANDAVEEKRRHCTTEEGEKKT